jgi:predicted hydrocarbon binding protein
MINPTLSPRVLGIFLEVLQAEIGQESLEMVLAKANLPTDVANPQAASRLTAASAADNFARIQRALRTFYGRGARGTLIRIGRLVWSRLLESAPITEKAQAQVVRALPLSLRRKAALDLLARLLRTRPDGVTIHTLDMDLMLVDRQSVNLPESKESVSTCYVTLGMIQEVLLWAVGKEHDVEETGCRAAGNDDCEFKITVKA